MCDYSLQGLPNRLAEAGEQLVTYRFTTGSIGMASPVDIATPRTKPKIVDGAPWWIRLRRWLAEPAVCSGPPAVCIAPGTRLRMSSIPDGVRRDFSLDTEEDVTFTQFSAEPFQYRDGVQFANGKRALLQALREGVAFEVLETAPSDTMELDEQLRMRMAEDERPLLHV